MLKVFNYLLELFLRVFLGFVLLKWKLKVKVLIFRFASARKCSTGGRALMQLDFIQLVSKLEKICTIRPIPHRDLVEVYIKAYYQPEEHLESWIKEHKVRKPKYHSLKTLTFQNSHSSLLYNANTHPCANLPQINMVWKPLKSLIYFWLSFLFYLFRSVSVLFIQKKKSNT